ncbi:MAG: gluconeogenesis factor YvcK family protein [Acidobacteriota bacterium]
MNSRAGIKVVCLGGGSGLSTLLSGLKQVALHSPFQIDGHALHLQNITGIVTVSDEGGSSGRIRRQFQTPAPGDVRNCLVALASDESLMTELFRYRFRGKGELQDHSLGNLLLTALADITGDFHKAIQLSSQVLAVEGQILPSTKENVRLQATLSDGSEVTGETTIAASSLPIRSVGLQPESCLPLPETLEAMGSADIITIGPGSLFTSLIPNLVVKGIVEAVEASPAVRIYIGNLMTQHGETDHLSASEHLKAIQRHMGGRLLFNHVLLNSQPVSPEMLARYEEEEADPVENDISSLEDMGVKVHKLPLLREEEKVRHHPVKLAEAILQVFGRENG